MKKILILFILYGYSLLAQNQTDCPFQARKYVHYDGIIKSASSFIPTYYESLVNNNSNYQRENSHLETAAKADCFYKTSIHNHDSIKKPFVFVEGISFEKPGITNNVYNMADYFRQDYYPTPPFIAEACLESYNSAPQYHDEFVGYSTFNWATLVTGIDAEGFYDGDALQVQKSPELLNKLCCAGYDICFVDFMSGEEYIESNGEALYSILVKIHQELIDNNSSEKMVVCGASMGGLVARYAINKLEAEGHTDWVEKFISFDSPQMGANIPLGLQYTLKHLKGLSSDLEEKYNKLTCPSASQLVNYSCLETSLASPVVNTEPVPSIERQLLMSNSYMGWPQYCTKIAISNGSRFGYTQSSMHEPGDKVLDIDGLVDMDLFALPLDNDNYQKVFDFDPPYCLLTALSTLAPGLIAKQTVRVKHTMALDLAAGSFRTDLNDIQSELPDVITGLLGQSQNICNFGWIDNSNNADKLCFIPTMSSIGYINYEIAMKSPTAVNQGVLNLMFDNTPRFEDYAHQYSNFDVVYAPANNQTHVEITDENIGWLMDEILGMPVTLVHENINIPSNTYKAVISIQAGNNIFNNPICNQQANGNGNSNPGGMFGYGNNNPLLSPCGNAYVASGHTVFYKAGQFIDLMDGFFTDDNAFFQAEIVPIPSCYSNARMSSSLGQGESDGYDDDVLQTVTKKKDINQGQALKDKLIVLFPNPSNSYCDINSYENIQQVSVSGVMGNLINSEQLNEKTYHLSTADLSEGVYLINIKTTSETVTKKVVVKHN